jgi:hypothetical protein
VENAVEKLGEWGLKPDIPGRAKKLVPFAPECRDGGYEL